MRRQSRGYGGIKIRETNHPQSEGRFSYGTRIGRSRRVAFAEEREERLANEIWSGILPQWLNKALARTAAEGESE